MCYFGARYYDARLSQFISIDPARDDLPIGKSMYCYVRNNPVKYIDPTGMFTEHSENCGTVTKGDTLSKITTDHNKKYGTSYDYKDIGEYNYGKNKNLDKINTGDTIYFPSSKKTNSVTRIMYGYHQNPDDQRMKKQELAFSIKDDVDYINNNSGGVAILSENATKQEMLDAIYNPNTVMIVFSGHGDQRGGIQTADDLWLKPEEIGKSLVGKSIKKVVFENCHQGEPAIKARWQKAFGANVELIGWRKTTNVPETNRFNSTGFADRQPKNLRDHINEVYNINP